MNSGIYTIRNKTNGHRYVGSALNLGRRRKEHMQLLGRRKHANAHLQGAWNKYGPDSFVFHALLYCDKRMLVLFEQRAMDVLCPEYNILPNAGSNLGHKHTTETRAKMSARQSGRKISKETRAKISKANKGNKNARGGKGRKTSDETKAKLSVAGMGNTNGKLGLHNRWHINRGIYNPNCELCREAKENSNG